MQACKEEKEKKRIEAKGIGGGGRVGEEKKGEDGREEPSPSQFPRLGKEEEEEREGGVQKGWNALSCSRLQPYMNGGAQQRRVNTPAVFNKRRRLVDGGAPSCSYNERYCEIWTATAGDMSCLLMNVLSYFVCTSISQLLVTFP